jgi:hypothetical protein
MAPTELEKIIWHDDERDNVMINDYFNGRPSGISKTLRRSSSGVVDVYGAFVFLRMLAGGKHLFEMPLLEWNGKITITVIKRWREMLRGMKILAGLPWWSGVWVLQETVLSPEATIYYGNIVVP